MFQTAEGFDPRHPPDTNVMFRMILIEITDSKLTDEQV